MCRLALLRDHAHSPAIGDDHLRARFLDLVTDENMRERVAEKTDRVRDVILASHLERSQRLTQDLEK